MIRYFMICVFIQNHFRFNVYFFTETVKLGVSSRSIFGTRGVMTNFKIIYNILFGMSAERIFFLQQILLMGLMTFCQNGGRALKLAQKCSVFSSFRMCRGVG